MPFDLLKCIIILSLCGSLITLILFLLLPLTKRLFSASWHYFAGVAALLFFFLPLSYIQPPASNQLVIGHSASIHTAVGFSFSAAIAKIGDFPVTVQGSHHRAPVSEKSVNVGAIAAILYLAAAASLSCIKHYKHACFNKNLRRISHPVEPGRESAIFQSALLELHIRRRIKLYSYAEPGSPFITGLIRPIVFIPANTFDLSNQETKLIFYHELTHYKRGDLIIKALCGFACLLHWFNPIILLLSSWLNRSSEMACDESIVERLEQPLRKCYGDAILNSILFSTKHGGTYSAALCSGKSALKERLVHIMSYKKSGRAITAISLCAALALPLTGYAVSQTVLKVNTAKSTVSAYEQIATYTKRIENFLDKKYKSNSSEFLAISDASVADKGAITASDTMSVELISQNIVKDIVKYAEAKWISVHEHSKTYRVAAPYCVTANSDSGTNWYANSVSRIRALANIFTSREGNGQPMYVIYLDKTGQPHTIAANDSNLKKAKAGIDPIPD